MQTYNHSPLLRPIPKNAKFYYSFNSVSCRFKLISLLYRHLACTGWKPIRQTYYSNIKGTLLTLALCMAFSLIFVHGTYADNGHKILDEDIELTFNGKTITQITGILYSEIKKDEANMLMIKLTSNWPDPNPKLRIILAKSNRPIAAVDAVNFSNQIEINLANLLLNAKPGDRIVLSFNDEERIMVIPIS